MKNKTVKWSSSSPKNSCLRRLGKTASSGARVSRGNPWGPLGSQKPTRPGSPGFPGKNPERSAKKNALGPLVGRKKTALPRGNRHALQKGAAPQNRVPLSKERKRRPFNFFTGGGKKTPRLLKRLEKKKKFLPPERATQTPPRWWGAVKRVKKSMKKIPPSPKNLFPFSGEKKRG
ncbi:hypothetical protein, partial [Ralstonia solanacearum]|uniref:hypothetical protein n=1 Tax=Ralstonia solanacearum TaxID=305 RepID=UPI0019D35D0B